MKYPEADILKFYRILAKRLLEIDKIYGLRHHNPGVREVIEKLEKLVGEVDSDQ